MTADLLIMLARSAGLQVREFGRPVEGQKAYVVKTEDGEEIMSKKALRRMLVNLPEHDLEMVHRRFLNFLTNLE